MKNPLQLNLDRLVVHGMSPSHTAALGPLVRAELERLIAAGGVPAALARGGRVPAVPPVRATPGMRPEAVAAEVARAVYGAMGGQTSAHAPAAVRPPSPPVGAASPSPAVPRSPLRPGTNGGAG